jgi:hypothetical protein
MTERDHDIHVFQSKSGGSGAGSEWHYKGTLAPGTHDEYLNAFGIDKADDDAADALGKLYGEGKYMVFDLRRSAGDRRKRVIEVVPTRAFRARVEV